MGFKDQRRRLTTLLGDEAFAASLKCTDGHYSAMSNLQVRLGDDDTEDLDELARELGLTRSEAARRALAEGMKRLRMERALGRFVKGEITLARAAQDAGVTIGEMADVAADRGIPYFRYPPEDLRADMERAKKILKA